MTKLVINRCFGGFGLSPEATVELWRRSPSSVDATAVKEYYADTGNYKRSESMTHAYQLRQWREYLANKQPSIFLTVFSPDETLVLYAQPERDDPELVKLVEEWGSERVSGTCSNLEVVEIPDDVKWTIEEYDGNEHVAEAHRTW